MRISDWSSDVCSSDLFEDAEQHCCAEPLPEEPIDLAGDTGTAERVRGRRTNIDRDTAGRNGPRPHREQAILPALQSALILAEDARAFLEQHDATVIGIDVRSEEHTSELQSLMRNSYAV